MPLSARRKGAQRTRTILLVAAEPRELSGILAHCANVAPLTARVQYARTGELRGNRCVLVANGPGAELARQAASIDVPADAIVSTGYCGAVNPAYRTGDIFVAIEVDGRACSRPATAKPHREGTLISADCVVADKHRVGADAVDMEAGAVAAVAAERGKPFFCVRSVLDAAGEQFALDFNRLRDRDGRFSRPRILAAALRRPSAGIPELVELLRRGRACSRALGDFIAECKF